MTGAVGLVAGNPSHTQLPVGVMLGVVVVGGLLDRLGILGMWPARTGGERRFVEEGSPDVVFARILSEVVPAVRRTGYRLKERSTASVTLRRFCTPWGWQRGLWRSERVTLTVSPMDGGRTLVVATGPMTSRFMKRIGQMLTSEVPAASPT